ncbi:hypothetical protein MMSR116_21510 [Methylobacterium mesophilicum SR1.6/6]|uniref:Uncharacterized protein n=2 Tax=Methylobacterium mesophilicum TaxID=39956 RepID=A0A6B9FT42_9HYPH|nr:hypothetical protein MMSR116_21510 [Methylobacterium mesophilicum SR1.6/6]
MVRRFTVIQGGLSGMPAAAPGPVAAPSRSEAASVSKMWRANLRAPSAVDEEAVPAWRAMLVRNAVGDSLRDPDHLMPLAHHQPAGRRVAIALAWGGRADPRQPAEATTTALVEDTTALAVDRALKARLAGLRRPIRLVGAVEPLRAAAPFRPRVAVDRSARPRSIPTGAFVGTRPHGWKAPAAEMLTVTEPEAVRDAFETFLTLEARTAHRPIIADPSEASLVRAVSRLFGRRSALRVAFLRRAGEIVSGTLRLGVGRASVPWLRARA